MTRVRWLCLLLTFLGGLALAAAADAGITDTVRDLQTEMEQQTARWTGQLKEIVVELVRYILYVGFFLALILNADVWSKALINGFLWAGNHVTSGGAKSVDPVAILGRGFFLGKEIFQAGGWLNFLAYMLLALMIVIVYAIIAAYVFLVYAEMYIVTAAGVLLLGFAGGMGWTDDYARRYLTYCLSVGAKLYVMLLVVGLGEGCISDWALAGDRDKGELDVVLSIVGVLIIMMLLVKMIPDMVQGIINGSTIGSGPPVTAMGVMAGAASGAAAVGSGYMAVKEASNLASSQLGSLGPYTPPGSKMAQTLTNLGQAAGQTLGGRMLGDPGAKGSIAGGMARNLHAKNLGDTLDPGGRDPGKSAIPTISMDPFSAGSAQQAYGQMAAGYMGGDSYASGFEGAVKTSWTGGLDDIASSAV